MEMLNGHSGMQEAEEKTLFNVCYALAIHRAALIHDLPVPTVLIVDSPTKNINEDEDPELIQALYRELYKLVRDSEGKIQLILIDSDLYLPDHNFLTSRNVEWWEFLTHQV